MITLLLCLTLFAGQALSHKPAKIVHLQPQRSFITADFGGRLLELINAPAVVYLPDYVPKLDTEGKPWQVDIRNAGPSAVEVAGKDLFRVNLEVGQTIHIAWNGTTYSLRH